MVRRLPLPFGKGTVSLLSVVVLAGVYDPAWAQGSLRLPPMPGQKAEPAPAPAPAPPVASAKPAPPAATSSDGAWPSDPTQQVKAIQLLLRGLDLYHNTTNGTLGPATRAAIRDFQHNNALPETGEPSEQLFNELQKKSH